MPPDHDFDPPVGVLQTLAPGLGRIVAPNPSPMTYRGTNTYLLGDGPYAVIDPGPLSPPHLEAILAAGPISHIFVTHAHLDHSPLAKPLAEATGAPVFAFGGAHAGRSPIMTKLARDGLLGGGEGVDSAFAPDHLLADGDVVTGAGWHLTALHTPGHIGNHLCFAWDDICFTGDHVMGWASSLVSPPDGDLTDFMASCARLAQTKWHLFFPGHGDIIETPAARLDWLIAHRKGREAEILAQLATGPATAQSLTKAIYAGTPAALLPAAERNVLAHLIDLTGRAIVAPQGSLSAQAAFSRV